MRNHAASNLIYLLMGMVVLVAASSAQELMPKSGSSGCDRHGANFLDRSGQRHDASHRF